MSEDPIASGVSVRAVSVKNHAVGDIEAVDVVRIRGSGNYDDALVEGGEAEAGAVFAQGETAAVMKTDEDAGLGHFERYQWW